MGWFNLYGLVIIIIMMMPSIIYAFKIRDGFKNNYKNKVLEEFENTGRIGSMIFMIFNIPLSYLNFWFENAIYVYLIINGILLVVYILSWIFLWKENNLRKVLLLSIVPSVMFLFSGIMILSVLLLVFAVIFASTHIIISIKNYNRRNYENL